MRDQPLQWMRSAAPGGQQATASCALCGIELPTGAMVPDGGSACADVRWYCRDTGACTRRWTEHQPTRPWGDERPGDERAEPAESGNERNGHWAPGNEPTEPGDEPAGDEHVQHQEPQAVADKEPTDEPAGRPTTGSPGSE